MSSARIPLPIDPFIGQIVQTVNSGKDLLLRAPPGTGKTTRVPAALLEAHFANDKEIWVLEPRRLAAKMAARRVAEELGESVGETVGYQFRFEKVGGPRTRLRFFTEGMVLRHMMSDPSLSRVAAVVLDEFHERHLQGDIALGVLRALQQKRPDLRLIVMSATLSTGRLTAFLNAPVEMDIPVAHHPLDIRYRAPREKARLEDTLVREMRALVTDPHWTQGDFLVFLPGMADIRRAENALQTLIREQRLALHALHGDLSKEEQEAAVTPGPTRKVILSTNVAESSLTIPGVRIVVDSGLHRQASASSWSGMPALRTKAISKASAIQRGGRAARTGPGLCVRLYSQGDYDHRPSEETPEVLRADLAQTLLELRSLRGIDGSLPWFEPPSPSALAEAGRLLYLLGASKDLSPTAALTPLGMKMASLPLHPRMAKLILEGSQRGVKEPAVRLAALLSDGSLDGLDALEAMKHSTPSDRILRALQSATRDVPNGSTKEPGSLAKAVLAAFPDRVGQLREKAKELVLSSGGSVGVDSIEAFGKHRTFCVLEAREFQGFGQMRATVRATSLVAIEEEWLLEVEPSQIIEGQELKWNAEKKRVEAISFLRFGALTLSEGDESIGDWDQAMEVILRNGLGIPPERREAFTPAEWVEALTRVKDRETLEGLFARSALMAQANPGKLPSVLESLRAVLYGKASFKEIEEADWESAWFPNGGRLFPSQVELPGGRKVKVQYALGREPWIESRLQDFFGMKQGPYILDGKLPLTLHLLAPNYRAVQVTKDLASFWKNTYPTVRKELSRVYPRHAWPEDPLTAKPPPPKPHRR